MVLCMSAQIIGSQCKKNQDLQKYSVGSQSKTHKKTLRLMKIMPITDATWVVFFHVYYNVKKL